MAIFERILEQARELADGEPLMPSHVAEASEQHHLAGNRPPDVARHYALLDALDFVFTELRKGGS